ncbi:hypothetical protein TRIUR3_05559 [Triticum urartu]|uniref:Uncharacterized protein n=1 Tax=Triticum urartu TaxID=4572 RepID=M7ZU01_TRIUA|nr:hypothetical protein TRIUR3_05559 [Triticum urartu]
MELGAPPAGPGACSGPEVSGDLQYLEVKMARPWEGGGNLQQGAGLGMTRWGICWPRKLGRMGGDPLGEMGGDGGGGGGSGGGGRRRRGRWRWRIQRWGATEAGGSGRRPGWRRGENSKLKAGATASVGAEKNSWPEVVGLSLEEAKKKITEHKPDAGAEKNSWPEVVGLSSEEAKKITEHKPDAGAEKNYVHVVPPDAFCHHGLQHRPSQGVRRLQRQGHESSQDWLS